MEVTLKETQEQTPPCMTWTSAAQAIWNVVRYTDRGELTLTEVMGYTSHAFRININPANVDVAGPTSFPWQRLFSEGLAQLGYRSACAESAPLTPPTDDELEKALVLAQRSIDRGIPAIAWDLFIPEFGVLYGYDDEKREFQARDVQQDGTLPYTLLGRGRIGELFVLTIEEPLPLTLDRRAMLPGALNMIIRHAKEDDNGEHACSHRNGLAGYDAWIEALGSGNVSPMGNAYNAAVVCDARFHAAAFLGGLADVWTGDSPLHGTVRRLAGEAERHYRRVHRALAGLLPLFPFPQGGTPNDPAVAAEAAGLLREAQSAEAQGVALLEELRAALHADAPAGGKQRR
ncbi:MULTISPECIES: hypothetical protein [Paenibacillus]|uniref:hypothetical protein n=1 Tax=Paenibacillus TaxID=44249 RepID=UPI0022B85AD4|nr:hypothetical protein [Paenibacillus caseinilyticus]MCZ8519228.1 hypothetical protein [Paenibacillus caseinilyticus]